ncbi:asparagine synthase (glutamine-hydrolyzing) [Bacteriovoracales bacterium]|nr:asparagine synthase (glutamine-hydrolyzing) [Bacteriovoracales bacterium]
MCGILGTYSLVRGGHLPEKKCFEASLQLLNRRGPNASDLFQNHRVQLGHTRLSIQDLSSLGNQPLWDKAKRYCLIYNGEIYNFNQLRAELLSKGYSFVSQGDSEVLLNLYIEYGSKCLQRLDGFFSFAVYDSKKDSLFLARDRFGIKPLVYSIENGKLFFSSEMKALFPLLQKKELDPSSLYQYLQFTYIPAPHSIFKGVKKLLPGHFLKVENGKVEIEKYFELKWRPGEYADIPYQKQKNILVDLLDKSVKDRLISDAPLGAFLSGGIDSSAVVALASRHVPHLKTFSIGFKNNKVHDETRYAKFVADKFMTDHTVIKIDEQDYLNNLNDVLDYLDEPFADSSALAVYILSKYVRGDVKVALSGDGADEVFAGYNKYKAEYLLRSRPGMKGALKILAPALNFLPKSRDFKFANFGRQINRLAKGAQLSESERYFHWCRFIEKKRVLESFSPSFREMVDEETFKDRCHESILDSEKSDFNQILYNDVHYVLPNDMLAKVDMMSMANSLEVRVPFLGHKVVEFAFSLGPDSKIDSKMKKKILQDSFKEILPKELYNRPKQGFSIPLYQWYRNELWEKIDRDLLSRERIEAQNIFSYAYINDLKQRVKLGKKDDVEAHMWSLIVFQSWYQKYME